PVVIAVSVGPPLSVAPAAVVPVVEPEPPEVSGLVVIVVLSPDRPTTGVIPAELSADVPLDVPPPEVPSEGGLVAEVVLAGGARPAPVEGCIATGAGDRGGGRSPVLTTMSPNCSGVGSRPSVSIGSCRDCPLPMGGWPIRPAGASTFWVRMALATSTAVRFRDASFCGSSQTRML